MKKVNRGQNAKTKTRMISFDVKIEGDRVHKCNHKFNCKKHEKKRISKQRNNKLRTA